VQAKDGLDALFGLEHCQIMRPTLAFSTTLVLGLAVSLLAQPSTPSNSVRQIESVQFSPDGKRLVTSGTNGTVRIWDVRTGKPLSMPLAHCGTWRLVSYKYGDATEWSGLPEGQKRLKLITDTHFTWVAYEPSGGKVSSMAGGTYTLAGEAYTETIDYAGEGMTDYLGKKQSFTIHVEGDELRQSGQLSDGTKIAEKWQRVK
jgi:hypothetical protein